MTVQEQKDELRLFIEGYVSNISKFRSAGLPHLKKGGQVVHQAKKKTKFCGPAGKALAKLGGQKVKCK